MTARLRSIRPHLLALGAAMVFAIPAGAQDASLATASAPVAATDSVAPTPTQAGPTLTAATVAVRRALPDAKTTTPPPAPRGGYGQSMTLMVVGGAAVLTGLIIGGGAGYAISVGGAVVGLVGLYQYMQ